VAGRRDGVILRALRRERLLVLGGVVVVAGLAWLDLWRRSRGVMDMTMPAMEPWSLVEFGAIALMWLVMMIAMMVPSATPMLLLFAAMRQERAATGSAAPVVAFAGGYLVVWAIFSIAAATLQAALQERMLLTSELAVTSAGAGAAVLALAGLYQLSPLKDACLSRCQSPLGFLLGHWRDGADGALWMGLRHGVYCLGCCWALMALLFALGIMNLAWVATLAVFVLIEKAATRGAWISRISGLALLGWSAWIVANGLR
jgi:predicted metal-binding membrane protein